MKYIIGLLVWFLSVNLFNFQTKNSIFKKIYFQTFFTLSLLSDSNQTSYKKVFQSLNKCLATCSFEEVCHLVQLNKSEQSCNFYTAIDGNSLQTTIDDNCIIYRKKVTFLGLAFLSYSKIYKKINLLII